MPSRKPQRRRTDRAAAANSPTRSVESVLHAACVKAGAAAALQVSLERLPLLKPFLPRPITHAARGDAPERIQRLLVKEIYLRYGIKPAGWEVEGILAVAQTQSVLTPLATQEGLNAVMRTWLPARLSSPLLRYTPLEPLVTASARAVAATWAAGRYADSVCRLRQAGADWLPAPLNDALSLAPSKLKRWSAEALALALPPLRLAKTWGERAANALPSATPKAKTPPKKRAPTRKRTRRVD
ncbi:hypothetical protein [Arenimonas sp.]|uniref:hypothetical protein n=1 Tax=Arenimonas sp. TaxID=1872635 RepID=UPI0039E400B5